jgi:hypothetical protein
MSNSIDENFAPLGNTVFLIVYVSGFGTRSTFFTLGLDRGWGVGGTTSPETSSPGLSIGGFGEDELYSYLFLFIFRGCYFYHWS